LHYNINFYPLISFNKLQILLRQKGSHLGEILLSIETAADCAKQKQEKLKNKKYAYIITYGCKQNESDSERIKGILKNEGYDFCNSADEADLILFNTCAVRENAEKRVFGNIGVLKAQKMSNPDLLIGVCGCMVQQPHIAERIKKRFEHIDFVFGTHAIPRLPQILHSAISQRVFDIDAKEAIHEDIPVVRDSVIIANVPIMYGCNNFCTYCVVPYVRGRERSREEKDILAEIEGLAAQGCKEVLLLGQNVNSYGKDNNQSSFPNLLKKINKTEGIERIRFISSHPKDFSDELIDVMAKSEHICKQLHLPFQSGSDNVLKAMNRRYTSEQYLKIIEKARSLMPDLTITSDVIVGFPTETQEDFEKTLELINKVQFDSLFTFIYSPRVGTKAAEMQSVLSDEQIKENFETLLKLQQDISYRKNQKLKGTMQKVLVEGESKTNPDYLTGRTDGGKVVNFTGDKSLVGKVIDAKITSVATWSLGGEIKKDKEKTNDCN
jgi:tRNA-2-methylthio-N6-dimethylallyladenosine synthase